MSHHQNECPRLLRPHKKTIRNVSLGKENNWRGVSPRRHRRSISVRNKELRIEQEHMRHQQKECDNTRTPHLQIQNSFEKLARRYNNYKKTTSTLQNTPHQHPETAKAKDLKQTL